MARPRSIEDEDLLSCAAEVLAEVGPSQFTLARAAARAGVAPATYIKRFGTKHGLFVALNRRWVQTVGAGLDAAASTTTGVDRIRGAALWGVAEMDVPEHAANMLAALALDLQYPAMIALLDQGWATWRARIAALVQDAIDTGDLPHAPAPPVAAQMLFALVEGTRIAWCVRPQGSLQQQLQQLIDELLSTWSERPSSTGQLASIVAGHLLGPCRPKVAGPRASDMTWWLSVVASWGRPPHDTCSRPSPPWR